MEIPALWLVLKDARDAVEEDNQGRGKTWSARDSEKYIVTKYQESH